MKTHGRVVDPACKVKKRAIAYRRVLIDACGFPASAAGETAEQASASAMRIKAEPELRKGFASSCFRGCSIEVWISVFIGVFPFYLVFGS